MKILRHEDYRRMPWKNGMGVTEEVLAFPPDGDLSTFGWRVSIAHVGTDGPFSLFPGIDRTIALLDGEGLFLDLPDRTVELAPSGDPFAFSGDVRISSRNKAGPTIDLNVMTRRGQFRHDMRRLAAGPIDIDRPATILVFNGANRLRSGKGEISVSRFDAVLADPTDGPLELAQASPAFRIAIAPDL
jgi:environmental stress-induced protein Ves